MKRLRRASTEVPASTLQCGVVVVVLDPETLVLGPLGTTTVTTCMQQAVGWHGCGPFDLDKRKDGEDGRSHSRIIAPPPGHRSASENIPWALPMTVGVVRGFLCHDDGSAMPERLALYKVAQAVGPEETVTDL